MYCWRFFTVRRTPASVKVLVVDTSGGEMEGITRFLGFDDHDPSLEREDVIHIARIGEFLSADVWLGPVESVPKHAIY